jgi:hypothetical protein
MASTARAPPVWSVSRWLSTSASTRSSSARSRGTSTRWPASLSAAKARPGVVDQRWRGRAHEHRVALPDVGRQQLETRPARGVGACHNSTGTNSGRPNARTPQGSRAASKPAAGNTPSYASPQRAAWQPTTPWQRADWPATPSTAARGLQRPGRQRVPQRRASTTPASASGRDHQRDPRNRQQVGHKAHHRHLAEQQQAQRGQRQRHHRLLPQQLASFMRKIAPSQRRWVVSLAPESVANNTPTATKLSQNPACVSAQGSSRTTTAQASSQTVGQGQLTPAQAQRRHRGQHGHDRALRRHPPAAEHRIGRCQRHATDQRRRGRWQPQAQPPAPAGRAPPQRADQRRGHPGKQGDVQARKCSSGGPRRWRGRCPSRRVRWRPGRR